MGDSGNQTPSSVSYIDSWSPLMLPINTFGAEQIAYLSFGKKTDAVSSIKMGRRQKEMLLVGRVTFEFLA